MITLSDVVSVTQKTLFVGNVLANFGGLATLLRFLFFLLFILQTGQKQQARQPSSSTARSFETSPASE